MNAWILALCLLVIHVGFTNAFEKLLTQQWFGSLRRPCTYCHDRDTFECLGMPSGHAESVVVFTCILLWKGMISLPVASVIVVLVCLQRIYALRHTVAQVAMGALLGLIYAALYIALRNDVRILITSALIPLTLLLLIVSKVNQSTYESFPSWVDPTLHDSMHKKQASHFFNKVCHILSLLVIHSFALFCNWSNLEHHLDTIARRVQGQNIQAIVGIKTGGAIISKYVAKRLGLPYYYIKVSADAFKCNKKAHDTYQDVAEKVVLRKKQDYIICEPIEADLQGVNVLVLDELVYSGVTLTTVRDYLLKEKQAASVTLAAVTTFNDTDFYQRKGLDILTATENRYVVWPWGFDN